MPQKHFTKFNMAEAIKRKQFLSKDKVMSPINQYLLLQQLS